MSNFAKTMDARRARADMIREAMNEFENSCRNRYGSPYAGMSGVLGSLLTSIASDRLDSTEFVVRQLKNMSKIEETV